MPDRTPCIHCGKVGLVRRERIIQAENVMIAFYCGACNQSWQIEDSGKPPAAQRKELRKSD